MYPLSAFIVAVSGANNVCTNNFKLNEDYYVFDKSAYIALSSEKWNDVTKVYTSPVSALDYISVSNDYIPSLTQFTLGPNQPFLSGGDRYFYKIATESGFISGYGFLGDTFVIYSPVVFCNVSNSFFDGSGNLTIASSQLQLLYVNNCAISGIYISQNTTLSGLTNVYFGGTYLAASNGTFDEFLIHLAQYGPTNGSFVVLDDAGYNNNPPSLMNPFNSLNAQGQTAMHTLTTTKGWSYTAP